MTQSFVTNGVRPGPRYLPICHAHAACSLARAGSVSNHDVHLLASHRPGLVRLGVSKVPCQTLPFSAATWPENNFKALSSLCQSDQSSAQNRLPTSPDFPQTTANEAWKGKIAPGTAKTGEGGPVGIKMGHADT